MRTITLLFLIFILVFALFGCESEEQKRIKYENEMKKSMSEINESIEKADRLQGLLDEYKKLEK